MMLTPKSRFWVVTYPSPRSTIEDVCFETDLEGLRNQFLGGLKADDICVIERDGAQARQTACSLLGIPYTRKA